MTKDPVDPQLLPGRWTYLCQPEGNYLKIAGADTANNRVVIAARRAASA